MKMLVAILSLAVLVVSIQAAAISQQQMENLAKELLKSLSASKGLGEISAADHRGSCSCTGPTCSCCHSENFSILGTANVCADVGYDEAAWEVWYKFSYNGDVLVSQTLSGKDPPPICVGHWKFRFLLLCFDFSNLDYANNAASGCLKVSLTADFTFTTINIATVDLGCFSLPVGKLKKGGHSSKTLIKHMTRH